LAITGHATTNEMSRSSKITEILPECSSCYLSARGREDTFARN